jgi:uncharacterized protein (DUF362 family)
MLINSAIVALSECKHYLRQEISAAVEGICTALKFNVTPSTRVLLKPNLLSGRSADHLACTEPEFVAAVAEWFVEQGAVVAIGDSPAFGTARGVMRATGIERALAGLPVELLDFDQAIPIALAGGVQVKVARAALECDVLVNLPRVKAHSQFYMTLAVKNYFGTVVGFQKPAWHLRYGDRGDRFASHLVDLLAVLPAGITLMDGIIAMHETGPISGKPFPLGLVAGTFNPVAADTALLATMGLDFTKSVIWCECARRGLAGADPDELDFPLLNPPAFTVNGFQAPSMLKPVSFNPFRMVVSSCRRFAARLKESP